MGRVRESEKESLKLYLVRGFMTTIKYISNSQVEDWILDRRVGKLVRNLAIGVLALATLSTYTISTGHAVDPARGEKGYIARCDKPDVYDPTAPKYGRRITQVGDVEINLCSNGTSSGRDDNDNGGGGNGGGGNGGGGGY